MTLAERLALALSISGLSQTEVEHTANLGAGYLSRPLRGERERLDAENLLAIARACSVDFEWLVAGTVLRVPHTPERCDCDVSPPHARGVARDCEYAGYRNARRSCVDPLSPDSEVVESVRKAIASFPSTSHLRSMPADVRTAAALERIATAFEGIQAACKALGDSLPRILVGFTTATRPRDPKDEH